MAVSRKIPKGYPELSFLSFDAMELLTSIQAEMNLDPPLSCTLCLQTMETLACIRLQDGCAGGEICLHSLFNRPDVPWPVVSHVLRHELLHLKIPAREIDGRIVSHPPEFWEAEASLIPWRQTSWLWMRLAFGEAIKVDPVVEHLTIKRTWKRLRQAPYPSWDLALDLCNSQGGERDEAAALMHCF